jgi:hypothetical protein
LNKLIKEAIEDLGGSCFVKLNWSAPKDAAWIAFGNSLECKTPQDIYLLLKSSDFIMHDLLYAYNDCYDKEESQNRNQMQFHLVIREWVGNFINPALEFRCFVKGKKMIAICQRDVRNYYPSLLTEKDNLLQKIVDFFECRVKDKFPNENCIL